MTNTDFAALTASIRAGALTASQMEDVISAIHSAYIDFNEDIYNGCSTNLEDVADELMLARKGAEKFVWESAEDDACRGPRRSIGYVHTVANVEGVSL